MLLKKQTVWLLTMLSLVVVLSVYYITSPEQKKSSDIAAVQQKGKDQNKGKTTTKSDSKGGKSIVSSVEGDAEFEALRMSLEDGRSEKKQELTTELASTDISADDRSKVKDQIDYLNKTAQKEQTLETFIKTMGYDDVLVRADGPNVIVTVKAKKKPSVTEANKIMLEVKKEMDETNYVTVEYQPSK